MYIPLPLSEEHQDLQDTASRLLARGYGPAGLRSFVDGAGYSDALWQSMAQAGLTGLALPEEFGGAGCGPVESFLVHREMGRELLASPYFSSVVLAGTLIAECADEAQQGALLPSLIDGTRRFTHSVSGGSDAWNPLRSPVSVRTEDGRLVVSGTLMHVPDADIADIVLMLVDVDGVGALVSVDAYADGVTVSAMEQLDLTRPMGCVQLQDAVAVNISPGADLRPSLDRALRRVRLALVAEQIGSAERLLSMAIDYAKTREQFGRPVGSFQAIKHKLAEVAFDVERMLSAGWSAALGTQRDRPDADLDVLLAKAFCNEALFRTAAETIQVHGGIGFTWEHDAHLYFRRARSSAAWAGDSIELRATIAARLLDHPRQIGA